MGVEWFEKEGKLYTKNNNENPLTDDIEPICFGEFTLENALSILNEMEERHQDLIHEFLEESRE